MHAFVELPLLNLLVLSISFLELLFRSCFEIRPDLKIGECEPNLKISLPWAVVPEKTYSSSSVDLVLLMKVFMETPGSLYEAVI